MDGRRTQIASIPRVDLFAPQQSFHPHEHEHEHPHLPGPYTKINTRKYHDEAERPSCWAPCSILTHRRAPNSPSSHTAITTPFLRRCTHTYPGPSTLDICTPQRTPHARPNTAHGDQLCATRPKLRVPTRERATRAERLIWNIAAHLVPTYCIQKTCISRRLVVFFFCFSQCSAECVTEARMRRRMWQGIP